MPEHSNRFAAGIDQQTDPDYLENTRYRSAKNVRVFSNEGGAYTIQNHRGDELFFDFPSPQDLGALRKIAIPFSVPPRAPIVGTTQDLGFTIDITYDFVDANGSIVTGATASLIVPVRTYPWVNENVRISSGEYGADQETNFLQDVGGNFALWNLEYDGQFRISLEPGRVVVESYMQGGQLQVSIGSSTGVTFDNTQDISIPEPSAIVLIGYAETSDKLALFTTDVPTSESAGYGQIWLLDISSLGLLSPSEFLSGTTINQYKCLKYNGRLGFMATSQITDAFISIEDEDTLRLHWTDNLNPASNLNIARNSPTKIGRPFSALILDSPESMRDSTEARYLPVTRFRKQVGGRLPVGQYQYLVRLISKNDSQSNASPQCALIPVLKNRLEPEFLSGEGASKFWEIDGAGVDGQQTIIIGEESTNGNEIEVVNIDPAFAEVELICIYYATEVGEPQQVYIVERRDVQGSAAIFTHTTNNELYDPVLISELRTEQTLYERNKNQAIAERRVIKSNLFERTDIDIDLSEVVLTYDDSREFLEDSAVYAPDDDGDGWTYPNGFYGNQNGVGYKNAYFANRYKSYWSWETYRVGIVFYLRNMTSTPAHHLGDLRMPINTTAFSSAQNSYSDLGQGTSLRHRSSLNGIPEASGPTLFDPANRAMLNVSVLGIRVENISIPADVRDQIIGFSIVRAPREKQVLAQASVLRVTSDIIDNDQVPNPAVVTYPYSGSEFPIVTGIEPLDQTFYRYYFNQFVAAKTLEQDPEDIQNTAPTFIGPDGGNRISFYWYYLFSPELDLETAPNLENTYIRVLRNFYDYWVLFPEQTSFPAQFWRGSGADSGFSPNGGRTFVRSIDWDSGDSNIPTGNNAEPTNRRQWDGGWALKPYLSDENFYRSVLSYNNYDRVKIEEYYYVTERGLVSPSGQFGFANSESNGLNFPFFLGVNATRRINTTQSSIVLNIQGRPQMGRGVLIRTARPLWDPEEGPLSSGAKGFLDYGQVLIAPGETRRLTKGMLTANIERPIAEPYGGTSPDALAATRYQLVGHVQPVDSANTGSDHVYGATVYGGDSFPTIYPRIAQYRCRNIEDPGTGNDSRREGIALFSPLETRHNIQLRHIVNPDGFTLFQKERDLLNVCLLSYALNPVQKDESFDYDLVWSRDADFRIYPGRNPEDPPSRSLPTRAIGSDQKSNGERINSFTSFDPNEFIDLETEHGPITHMASVFAQTTTQLSFWQPTAVGYIILNERILLGDSAEASVGTGKLFADPTYISREVGCRHKNSISVGDRRVYWMSIDQKGVYRWAQNGIDNISRAYRMQPFFDEALPDEFVVVNTEGDLVDNPVWNGGFSSGYDFTNDSYFLTFIPPSLGELRAREKPFTVLYTENDSRFECLDIGRYPSIYMQLSGNRLVAQDDGYEYNGETLVPRGGQDYQGPSGSVWWLEAARRDQNGKIPRNTFMGRPSEAAPASVTFIVNPSPDRAKTFRVARIHGNQVWRSVSVNGNLVKRINRTTGDLLAYIMQAQSSDDAYKEYRQGIWELGGFKIRAVLRNDQYLRGGKVPFFGEPVPDGMSDSPAQFAQRKGAALPGSVFWVRMEYDGDELRTLREFVTLYHDNIR